MCEIFAINARRSVRANETLRIFFEDSVMHPHGWGLCWRDDQGEVVLHKEGCRAIDSPQLSHLLDQPVCARRLVAHIRQATMGRMTYHNAHPFVLQDAMGETWVIAHNGTVFDDSLTDCYRKLAQGDTDSERAALYLRDQLDRAARDKGAALSFDDRFEVLARAIEALAPASKLNLAIDDGIYTYLHTNTARPTLYGRVANDTATFCTRPLDDRAGWEPLPSNRLLAYRDGCLVRTGVPHGFTIDEDRYLQMVSEMEPVTGA